MMRRVWLARTLAFLAAAAAAAPSSAGAALIWGPKNGVICESPSTFYSHRHTAGQRPCCPLDDGVCPGGAPCPPSGVCADGGACLPTPMARPNVILFVADDQGECHYGSAGECRSGTSGTPIPAPATPNLDALAAAGTVFPIAHNTASWCYPSLNSILTGRYQKNFGGTRNALGERFLSIPRALRTLGSAPGTTPDPFDPQSRVGGYCTLQGGKFTASAGRDPGFNARILTSTRRLGRLSCTATPGGGAPLCGTDMRTPYDPFGEPSMRDLFHFIDAMVYPTPGSAEGAFTMQQFFVWYAPRIPHQPLNAPAPIGTYLFGSDGNGGLFQLGALCTSESCAIPRAFTESNFGTVRDYYDNVYLADANVGEIRKFLEKTSAPHCIGGGGQARFDVGSPGACGGTWATSISPDPATNTIIVYLSDNGWQLPDAKHHFSENGYRTRLIVFDPRTPATGIESPALAHSTDLLPSLLGFALDAPPGTQTCPTSDWDGTACDGRDFRAQLATLPPETRAPASALRRSLCGHETQRPASPTRQRYLVTGPDTVGRCVLAAAAACAADTDCGAAEFCLGGHCTASAGQACTTSASCPVGARCLDGKCVAGPPCIDDAACTALLGADAVCAAKDGLWCANAPDVACGTVADCPACPTLGGQPTACQRRCEPHRLKLYLDSGGGGSMTDLFGDLDERGLHDGGAGRLATLLSDESGPYGATIRSLACCLDDWWTPTLHAPSPCGPGDQCPVALTCNR